MPQKLQNITNTNWSTRTDSENGGKYSEATQSLWPSVRAWCVLFYLQRSFFICSVRFYLQRSFFICSVRFLFAAYCLCLRVHFLFAACLFCLQCFFFICGVYFLFAAFLFYLQRFFFVCSVSLVGHRMWAIVIFSLSNRWLILRAELNERRTVNSRTVEQGTKRGKTSLVDSLGFTYNVHSRRPYATYWQYDAPKGKSVQGLSDGAERDLPTSEERAQPCSGYGSCYRGQNNFYGEVKSVGGQSQLQQ